MIVEIEKNKEFAEKVPGRRKFPIGFKLRCP